MLCSREQHSIVSNASIGTFAGTTVSEWHYRSKYATSNEKGESNGYPNYQDTEEHEEYVEMDAVEYKFNGDFDEYELQSQYCTESDSQEWQSEAESDEVEDLESSYPQPEPGVNEQPIAPNPTYIGAFVAPTYYPNPLSPPIVVTASNLQLPTPPPSPSPSSCTPHSIFLTKMVSETLDMFNPPLAMEVTVPRTAAEFEALWAHCRLDEMLDDIGRFFSGLQ